MWCLNIPGTRRYGQASALIPDDKVNLIQHALLYEGIPCIVGARYFDFFVTAFYKREIRPRSYLRFDEDRVIGNKWVYSLRLFCDTDADDYFSILISKSKSQLFPLHANRVTQSLMTCAIDIATK